MANIVVNNNIQQKYSYNFVEKEVEPFEVDYNTFKLIMSFISTEHKAVNIIGGEPLLSPIILEMLNFIINNDYMCQIFTTGMINNNSLLQDIKYLLDNQAAEDQISFSINMNDINYRSEQERKSQELFMRILGKYTYASFVIRDACFSLDFVKDNINNYGLSRYIRIGLQLPIYGRTDNELSINDYKAIGNNIIDFAKNNTDLTIILDCGFPMCMFDINDIGFIHDRTNHVFNFDCGHPMDIYPDLSVVNCNPLRGVYKTNISKFKTVAELRNDLSVNLATANGIFKGRCSNCFFFRKMCLGGCKGYYKPINVVNT